MHKLFAGGMALLFAVAPTSTNYILKTYDMNGGGANGTSTNYKLNGTTGSQTGTSQSSSNYGVLGGENSGVNSNVPPAPTVTNPSSYYDRLQIVINTGNNPSDTRYLIAISPDNFASTTYYIQNDNTLGSNQTVSRYQTYGSWGGASGFLVLGLANSTTYTVKVKALQGGFSGSAFGPTASAATVAPSLTFSLATTGTGTPPFPVAFTSLTPSSVVSGNFDALVGLTSNALNGGTVYVKSNNGSLLSALAGSSIPSATADLSVATSGYGAQVISTSQSSGGPLASASPFNGASNNVGVLSTALQPIVNTSAAVTTGNATVRLKAKATAITPSAGDYADTLTFVAAMNF